MKTIIAAGGLVQNSMEELLFIFRKGKWDLPKGKVEKGEKIEEAAIREVMEECGIPELKIIRPLKKTFHKYELQGKKILKETHWFLMKTEWAGNLVPQKAEGIYEAVWADKTKTKELMENTYDTIKEVMREFKG